MCVFIRRELIWFCSSKNDFFKKKIIINKLYLFHLKKKVAEFDVIGLRTGPNTPNATKASLLVSFQLFGTLMCFICSHFSCNF